MLGCRIGYHLVDPVDILAAQALVLPAVRNADENLSTSAVGKRDHFLGELLRAVDVFLELGGAVLAF